jgi:hypothetical protein
MAGGMSSGKIVFEAIIEAKATVVKGRTGSDICDAAFSGKIVPSEAASGKTFDEIGVRTLRDSHRLLGRQAIPAGNHGTPVRLLQELNPNDALAYQSLGKLFHEKAKDSRRRADWEAAQEAFQQSLAWDRYRRHP